jgi:hypothetical protein
MATINSGIREDANFLNLKEIGQNKIRSEVFDLLVPGENVIQCFQTVRDQVIFTSKRVFVINVQGITGKKVAYFSYPYSNVLYFGIETAGVLDIDSELIMTFANGTVLQFDFRSKVDIKAICANIQQYIL